MASLHPRLLDALPMLPRERPLHLLTRHSVREEAKNGFADYRLQLTPEGITLARDWGAKLPRPVSAFYSSPVARCVETARAMGEGGLGAGLVREPLEPETVPTLVEPGCYVEDVRRVGPEFFRLGAVGFINRHLSGGMEGMLSPQTGRARLLHYMRERDPEDSKLAVHVTHDTILAAFVAGLTEQPEISDRDWPWMMEGLWLWFDTREVHWIWRGEAGSRALEALLAVRE